jgi:fructose-1,6-bisphosphatase/inositol monophosphatase family enzyme
VRHLAQARLCATSAKLMVQQQRGAAYERLRAACLTDRGWSDAYGYALLATGRVEIVLDPLMSIWDTAALVPVVTEAGGTLTDWSGTPTHTAPEALATNGHLLEAVLREIRGTP